MVVARNGIPVNPPAVLQLIENLTDDHDDRTALPLLLSLRSSIAYHFSPSVSLATRYFHGSGLLEGGAYSDRWNDRGGWTFLSLSDSMDLRIQSPIVLTTISHGGMPMMLE